MPTENMGEVAVRVEQPMPEAQKRQERGEAAPKFKEKEAAKMMQDR